LILRIVVITILAGTILIPFGVRGSAHFVYKIGQNQVSNVDTIDNVPDSLEIKNDSLALDSMDTDSLGGIKFSKDTLEADVNYQASDSIIFDNKHQRVYMYGDAKVTYQTITLESEFIILDWKNKLITARGVEDTMGNFSGTPVFTEDGQNYRAKVIVYNYQTKKGKIFKLITKEGEGYIHGDQVKRETNDDLYIKTADYTTCDLDDPHFSIHSSRLKVIPGKVVVTGPAYLKIEHVPVPMVLPFGIFPVSKGRKSGILFPEYGESKEQGFFLKEGGYYFAVSDYMNISLKGDVYSRGSWATRMLSNYVKRYKYLGSLKLDYAITKLGEPLTGSNTKQTNFFIKWNHRQDSRARPSSSFGASVNAGTSTFHRYNSYDYNDVLENTYSSSISYSKRWAGTPFSFSSGFSHSQSTKTRLVDLSLPDISFNMSRIQPFQRKMQVGRPKWYENTGITYSMKAKNSISVIDSLLFKESSLQKFRNGISHKVDLGTSMKVFKHFSLSPAFNYNENWYLQTYRHRWNADSAWIEQDTVNGFQAARSFTASLSLSTNIYGTMLFKKGKLKGIRHIIKPSLSLNYNPDFGNDFWGYWKDVQSDTTGKNFSSYSIFDKTIFGGPARGEVASIGMAINNSLAMKVFSKKDSVNHSRKIRLLESFRIGSNYNFVKDSLNLSRISASARTTLFEKIKLSWQGTFDPYMRDSTGRRRINRFEWNENGRAARLTHQQLNISVVGLNLNNRQRERDSDKGPKEEMDMINQNPDSYVDFNVPWSLILDYSLTISEFKDNYKAELGRIIRYDSVDIVQSFNFNVELNITPKWKITCRSGYDFVNNKFTYTSVNIYRDLHCWDMKFHWIPFGNRQSYSVDISVKSSILQDLKLSKKRDWYDYQ